MKQIVFKFNTGLGNRLCNLMNMFYIHEKYPNALIYMNWCINNHCNIQINDIIDLSKHTFILSYDNDYNKNVNNINYPVWASTSNDRTKWDDINEWDKHAIIVSVSIHLYLFVTNDYCKHMFNNIIQFKQTITELVSFKISKYGECNKIIHFRGGDFLKILYENESTEKVNILTKKIANLKLNNNIIIREYLEDNVDRKYDDMLESISDLIYLSKYNKIIGYCPYSHFSSWIFLLSSNFIDNKNLYPIFNYKCIDIILLPDN